MNRIKKALVALLWLMVASVPMILVGLIFVIAAVYVSFAVLGAIFFGVEALGPLSYLLPVAAVSLGAGSILLVVRIVNWIVEPRFIHSPVPNPGEENGS